MATPKPIRDDRTWVTIGDVVLDAATTSYDSSAESYLGAWLSRRIDTPIHPVWKAYRPVRPQYIPPPRTTALNKCRRYQLWNLYR